MTIAAVAVLIDLVFCCLVVAPLYGSALQRAECPHCLGRDTRRGPGRHCYCRECEGNFELVLEETSRPA